MRRAETVIDWRSAEAREILPSGKIRMIQPPVRGASPVYWWVNDVLEHKGWLMPEVRTTPIFGRALPCDLYGHIFDLNDDACCDICGVPKREVVDMRRYRQDWRDRLNGVA